MSSKPIDPISDARVSHFEDDFNGRHYHYVVANSENEEKGKIFLVHGWPDLWIGWRFQIPMLIELGYSVVCMDSIGYGGSEAPHVPPASMEQYSLKAAADDIKALAEKLGCTQITVGGHDWGGLIAYRTALWHPSLVKQVFSVCTPYSPPSKHFSATEELVHQRGMKFWTYQLQLASGAVEEHVQSREQVKQALQAAYGARTKDGKPGFDVTHGFLFENLARLGPNKLVDDKLMDFYADQYAKRGMHPTRHWYNSFEQNFLDERQLGKETIDVPTLFVQATRDAALPPALSAKMERFIPQLTWQRVATSHWALWQAPNEVNHYIKTWLQKVDGPQSSL